MGLSTARATVTFEILNGDQFTFLGRTITFLPATMKLTGADRVNGGMWPLSGGLSAVSLAMPPLGASAPAGMVYTQNGNVVNITTNGQCIPLPTSNNLCEAPQHTAATGISMLTSSTVISSEFRGFSWDIPGIPNPLQSVANNFSNTKHCTRNVPSEGANLTINSDVCYDMTAQFDVDQFQGIPGVTVTPPITWARKDTTTTQIVPDCFATDAESIFDAFTKEFWIKQNGTFVKQ